ncbi:NAD(P)H:quinone oxidoreductase [Acetobacteraceae bacterium]|nr:NAD(P)H:quinone oxidoreductase [Acetobacteraceae bacterium]
MPKILVLYHSTYGHVETLAYAIEKGAKEGGASVSVKRVPFLISDDVAKSHGMKVDQKALIATPEELAEYDGIIFGCPTRFGRLSSELASFLDRTGGLWAKGVLIGKSAAIFTSTGTQHGGQETTPLSLIPNLLAHGMVVLGLPYAFKGLSEMTEISGGSPFAASTIAGSNGSRKPTENELAGAQALGKHVAEVTAKLIK